MDAAEVWAEFERQWEPWMAAVATIPPSSTRRPGVCGPWTIHDVVAHVHCYVRYHLVQARAAFTHIPPMTQEVLGDRGELQHEGGSLDARNEALRVASLPLEWRQVVDEAAWLRAETRGWLGTLSTEELDEPVGWVEYWNSDVPQPDDLPLHLRRIAEIPTAVDPTPLRQFILPDKPPDRHVTEHLDQIRASLGAPRRREAGKISARWPA